MAIRTYTFQGLKKELRGNVSETTLEHFKKMGWLMPDHYTPKKIARYTLQQVEDAKRQSLQAVEQTNILRPMRSCLTPSQQFDKLEEELGLKNKPKFNYKSNNKRRSNGKAIHISAG